MPIPHIVSFPLSYLDKSLHWVDPEILYEIHSKGFISKVGCPQAAVLDPGKLSYPCVLKTCRASSGWHLLYKQRLLASAIDNLNQDGRRRYVPTNNLSFNERSNIKKLMFRCSVYKSICIFISFAEHRRPSPGTIHGVLLYFV